MISSLPTIAEAARLMRTGELTPVDLVEYCLSRIDQFEDQVHAWVLVDKEGARETAQRQTRQFKEENELGWLTGIPVGIKDIVDVAGMPTKAGSPLREGHVASRDAEVVKRLRDAGAIILGKTVTTELACFDPPPTRNPWNLEQTPGGSSSGSAVAVAMEMCMAAIGSQTGGSITRPASYCGVAGFKPTRDTVPVDGVVPISGRLDHLGPIARCVRDLVDVYLAIVDADWVSLAVNDAVLAGLTSPLSSDTLELDWSSREDASAVFDWLVREKLGRQYAPRIVTLDRSFWDQAAVSAKSVTEAALRKVQDDLVAEREMKLPLSFSDAHTHHRRIMAVDAAEYHRQDYEAHSEQFGTHVTALIEEGLQERAVDYAAAIRHQSQFGVDINERLTEAGFAAMPSTTTTAPGLETTGDPRFNSPWSYAGVPTVTIPCGLADDGLPCGLQLIGPPGSEARLLRAAIWCEERLAFNERPPMLKGNS